MTPSFRSSGVRTQIVQQADGRYELVGIQVNVIPVSADDAGNMEVVAQTLVGTFNAYPATMSVAEVVSALRYAADQLEQHQG